MVKVPMLTVSGKEQIAILEGTIPEAEGLNELWLYSGILADLWIRSKELRYGDEPFVSPRLILHSFENPNSKNCLTTERNDDPPHGVSMIDAVRQAVVWSRAVYEHYKRIGFNEPENAILVCGSCEAPVLFSDDIFECVHCGKLGCVNCFQNGPPFLGFCDECCEKDVDTEEVPWYTYGDFMESSVRISDYTYNEAERTWWIST